MHTCLPHSSTCRQSATTAHNLSAREAQHFPERTERIGKCDGGCKRQSRKSIVTSRPALPPHDPCFDCNAHAHETGLGVGVRVQD